MSLLLDLESLTAALQPILDGRVAEAAVDTETTPVLNDRFTAYASPTRIAGFSVSYDLEGRGVDLYAAVRHVPYDFRRRPDLIANDTTHNGKEWLRVLEEEEGVRFLNSTRGCSGWLEGWDPNLDLEAVQELWQALFAVPGVTWYAHNWPFDAKMFDVEGVSLPWDRMECTKALSTFTDTRPLDLWDPDLREGQGGYVHGGHSLKHLGEVYLGVAPEAQAKLNEARAALGAGSESLNDWSMLPLRTTVAPYGCMDTRLCLDFARHAKARESFKDSQVRALLDGHQAELPTFIGMERSGIPVDREACSAATAEKERAVAKLVARITKLAGRVLKLNHGEQLSDQLYRELGLPQYRGKSDTQKATLKRVRAHMVERGQDPTGPITSDAAVEILDAILDYRKAWKELTSFYRPLTNFGETGRIHPVLQPMDARTTRATAAKPNAMQIPRVKKGKTEKETRANQEASVRHLFKPDPGHVFLALDYGQQELRVGAHYSMAVPKAFEYRFTWGCTLAKRGDCKGRPPHGPADDKERCRRVTHAGWRPNYAQRPARLYLADGFLSGAKDFDPHQAMVGTCEQREVPIDRDEGKTANFALLYGCGNGKLSETIDCTWEVARDLSKIFWEVAYPELGHVRAFVEERLRRAGKPSKWSHQEFIRTLHGGRIYLDGGFKGLNYLVQRSCREILLKAILGLQDYTMKVGATMYRPVLPVHDELMFTVPEADLDLEVVRGMCQVMVSAGAASLVPMVVEPNVCRESWAVKEDLPEGWGWDGVSQGVQPMEEVTG